VQKFTELEYLIVGLVSTVPAFLIPLFLVGKVLVTPSCFLFTSSHEELLVVVDDNCNELTPSVTFFRQMV
jgi:hypothetical protein